MATNCVKGTLTLFIEKYVDGKKLFDADEQRRLDKFEEALLAFLDITGYNREE